MLIFINVYSYIDFRKCVNNIMLDVPVHCLANDREKERASLILWGGVGLEDREEILASNYHGNMKILLPWGVQIHRIFYSVCQQNKGPRKLVYAPTSFAKAIEVEGEKDQYLQWGARVMIGL